MGMYLRRIGIDCNITLEESSFSLPRLIPMTGISRFILRLISELLNFSHLLSFHLFVIFITLWTIDPPPISSFSYRRSLIRSHSSISQASNRLLLGHFWLPFPLDHRYSAGSIFVLYDCQRAFLKNLLSTSSSSDL